MNTDIERELRQLGDVMLRTSEPVTVDEIAHAPIPTTSTPVQRVNGTMLDHERPRHRARPAGERRRWLTAAAVAMVVGGITAVWAVARNEPATPSIPADQPVTPRSVPSEANTAGEADPSDQIDRTSAVTVPEPGDTTSVLPLVEPIPVTRDQVDQPSAPWDDIAVAPGTVGWYDLDTAVVPNDLAARLGEPMVWDTSYMMNFYRCPTWQAGTGSVADGTLDATGITCDGLEGGYREVVEFGDTLGVGTGIGRSDWTNNELPTIETLLFGLANGSLWGYEDHDTPPEPTRHDIDGVNAVSYRVDDHAYLVLEPTPGTFVWLHARGLSDTDLEAAARALEPVELPDALPVPIVLGPDLADTHGSTQLKLMWLDGRPCVGLHTAATACTPADAGPALITASIGAEGQRPSVAAITPAGDDYQLTIALFGIDEWQTVPRTFIGLGITSYVYPPSNERLFEARLTDPNGDQIAAATWSVDSMINGFAPDLVGEGRTDGIAWVVVRQDPAWDGPPPSAGYRDGYCLLLFEAGDGFAPLCPPAEPPVSGLGVPADYHRQLTLIEVAADITSLTCDGTPLDIIVDDRLDNRRFVVSSCDDPVP